ncbi:MAG TPA: Holliday junction resolvase RuvX [Sulfurihydrogenibium sp.]|uniref:Putative pre-16S rRNA nuclease n=1 Tax=Sulfurihydrogenibium sp. (strain YO3AOP1) TaxID=436114 RepID=YQGF_SULSY|nr:Holliday junction resolvase RuvX [Sulfurihydrogenibium sp. YO3AOP1]B2V842.1 RecName: Full=Putative pre-16S rRNA nuclease [Sulfurihydrogenibium sp. YO3AOP1]ACD66115.1 Holliday junction resolvase YqgF [Sulfurihydrogenibium sp. YO3AOP1]HBT98421.1 Holliday junction resolvase RuvX [Sulfurihydrogenibium sp.]
MSRILGLDIGLKRIGVAVSDPFGVTATPLEFILNDEKVFEKINDLIKNYKISKIVIGLPLTLKGEEGEQARYTKEFVENLKNHIPQDIEIIFVDERFTSSLAEKTLLQTKKKNKKEKIDSLSAVFILQTYLDRLSFSNEATNYSY